MIPADVLNLFLFSFMSTLMACVFLSIALPLSFLCLLHNSTPASDLFLKGIPFCCVSCHSSYTETFKSIWTAWPDTCAGLGYAHKKETKGFWLSWYGPKSSTQFTASAPAVLSLCENHAGLNPDAIGAHFLHWLHILPSFSLLPKSKGTGGDLEVCCHILSEAMGLLLKPKSSTHWH